MDGKIDQCANRPKYIGAVVLGMNDALIELTGVMAGLTFALMNNRLVMLAGIITGVSAALSMAASSYLSEKTREHPRPLRAGLYTGFAYLTVITMLVLPYAVFYKPENAFAAMLITAALIIFLFNLYWSVKKSKPFFKKFAEMATICFGVATLAFGIGQLAKYFLGV